MPQPLSIEGYLAAVLNCAQDAIISTDLDGSVVSWNPAAERVFGYPQQEMIGRSLSVIADPHSQAVLGALLQAVRSGEEQVRRTLTCCRSDGSQLEVEMTLAALRERGREIGVTVIAHDITELKGTRNQLDRLQQRLKLMERAAGVATWDWDLGSNQVYWSDQLPLLCGLPADVGEHNLQFWMNRVHPGDRARLEHALQLAKEGRAEFDIDLRVLWPDGSVHWLSTRGQMFRGGQGEPLRMMGITRDVTERRHMDEARRQLAAIVEQSADAIIGQDMDGVITSWNAGARAIYGHTAEEVLGRNVSLLMPENRSGELLPLMENIRRGEVIDHFETQRRTKDGRIIDVSLSVSPIAEDNGTVVGASTIARDITERKRAEEALRNSEKLAATGRLAASIAHEINNPLESVTNLLYLLEHHGGLDESARQYIIMAGEELARIVHITRQTLGFYRESAAPVSIQLSELLNNVLELYARRLQTRRVNVQKRFGPQPEIRGFPGEMRQVFSNLIVNALEAVPEGGEVKLHVFESQDWSRPGQHGVRIVIADNGPGIPAEHRRRIFEPFYTTKGERGTGLGLWVSKGIVQKYGGSIRVRSSVDPRCSGTVFSVFLPAERQRFAEAA